VLADKNLWDVDLSNLKGFADAVKEKIQELHYNGAIAAINNKKLKKTET